MIFLLWLLGGVGWLGCSGCKEKNATGQILEFGTEKPISGATLTLRACEGEVLGNFNCTDVATTKSDADGNFDFDQDGTVISGDAPGFWDSGDDFAFINRKDGCPVPATLHLYPFAWLKVKLNNESGAFQITAPGENLISNGRSIYLGQGIDTTIYFFRKGNQEFKYIFSVIPQAGEAANLDLDAFKVVHNGKEIETSLQNSAAPWFNIYLPGHDTTYIIINY